MKNPLWQMTLVFAVLALLFFVVLEGRMGGQGTGLLDAKNSPVLVFVIPGQQSLARVRTAIRDERLLFENDHGFAVSGARVYVSDRAYAGDLISMGKWVERPIKIVSLGGDEGAGWQAGDSAAEISQQQRIAKLRKLVHKTSLSRVEQLFVLQAMNDGLEI
jgi:hypothetical protein